ncbi:Predicted membrane protein [Photobacterium damselae]|nr:Predicted membrane protein [Photobacterium damselae]
MLIYILDMFGTAIFAISGVLLAGRLRMDPFGVVVLASVTAIGAVPFVIWLWEQRQYFGFTIPTIYG